MWHDAALELPSTTARQEALYRLHVPHATGESSQTNDGRYAITFQVISAAHRLVAADVQRDESAFADT